MLADLLNREIDLYHTFHMNAFMTMRIRSYLGFSSDTASSSPYPDPSPGCRQAPGSSPTCAISPPAYLPVLVIGVYAFKHAGLDGDGVKEALRTLFWLAVIDLPLTFVVLQVIAGQNHGGQVTFITTLTCIFLAGAAVLMLFPLAWEIIVDFRLATSCWEGYHFWIPVVQYIWYIQYTIFPL